MYEVRLINSNGIKIVNVVSSDSNAPRCAGKIKQAINTINSFDMYLMSSNQYFFNSIVPKSTRVEIQNTKTNKYEFKGRILTETKSMSSGGVLTKRYLCEDALGYLKDSVLEYEEYHNLTVKQYVEMVIIEHNKQVESYKQFKLGIIDSSLDGNDSLYRYTSYANTWENIQDDLIHKLGGELRVRYEDDGLYLDYVKEIGGVSDVEIRLGYNMKDIELENDMSDYPTRIIPLGRKLKKIVTNEEGNTSEEETEIRLDISTVNGGKKYIDITEAQQLYGITTKYLIYEDVEEVSLLKKRAEDYINSLRVTTSNKINALDLSLIGLEYSSFEVGNYHKVIHKLLDIDYNIRIIEKEIDIENPQASTLTFGDRKTTFKDQYSAILKNNNQVENINKQVVSITRDINYINNNVSNTLNKVKVLEENEGNYITTAQYNTLKNNYDTRIKDLEDRLKLLEGDTSG